MEWKDLDPANVLAFREFCHWLTFSGRIQLSAQEEKALMQTWLACSAWHRDGSVAGTLQALRLGVKP